MSAVCVCVSVSVSVSVGVSVSVSVSVCVSVSVSVSVCVWVWERESLCVYGSFKAWTPARSIFDLQRAEGDDSRVTVGSTSL